MSFLTLVVQTSPNTFLGYLAGVSTQSSTSPLLGAGNVAMGEQALRYLQTGNYNVAIGLNAALNITTGNGNTALGTSALSVNLVGSRNTAVGLNAMQYGYSDDNTAIGYNALSLNAAQFNVAVGGQSLNQNGAGTQNTAVGHGSSQANTSGNYNAAFGYNALNAATTGSFNTAIGYGSGRNITTGSKNSILGFYSGNQGGLDIRTLSNYIVLSDGDGNPRLWIDNTGAASIPGGILSPTISGSLTITGGTVTASNPVLQATQTWNNAGVAFTGWQLNITDTASNGASLLIDLQLGGSSLFSVRKDGYVAAARYLDLTRNYGLLPNVGGLTYLDVNGALIVRNAAGSFAELARLNASGLSIGTSQDVILTRDAANTLAQRNGVNAQTFRIYNTFTDASNYSRLAIIVGSRIDIVPEWAGTGASKNVRLGLGNNGIAYSSFIQGRGVNGVGISSGGATDNWIFDGTANFTNDYDFNSDVTIGARIIGGGNLNFGAPHLKLQGGAGTGNGRGAEVYAVGSLSGASGNTTQAIYELFRGYILTANEQMLSFGGKTSSFPALKRRSANLQTVGADDTGTAGFIVGNQALATTATDGFIYVPSCAGVPTGVPTAYTGTIPHVVDTTNKHAYWYIAGAWWRANLV